MTNQLNLKPANTKLGLLTFGTSLSAFALAAALTFSPAFASPGHDNDKADHEMGESCMNHDDMSADEHEKGHDEGMEDCDMDMENDHDDGDDSGHQH